MCYDAGNVLDFNSNDPIADIATCAYLRWRSTDDGAHVTYAPTGGEPNTESKKVRLKRRTGES